MAEGSGYTKRTLVGNEVCNPSKYLGILGNASNGRLPVAA